MSSNATPLTVNVSGGHTLHRIAELCDVSFTVTHESEDRRETITKVTETANDISKALREMAPVKLVQGGSADLTASTTVEEADQAAEERDIEKPVAKWTMARLHTYSFVPYISNRKVEDREPNRKHKTSASFSATFRDFKKMEEFVNDLIRTQYVEVGNLGWRITRKTRETLQTAVRQAALKNAQKKAADYASVYGDVKLQPIEINDGYTPSNNQIAAASFGAPRAMMRSAAPGGSQNNEPDISFEPEEVAVSTSIQARFLITM